VVGDGRFGLVLAFLNGAFRGITWVGDFGCGLFQFDWKEISYQA